MVDQHESAVSRIDPTALLSPLEVSGLLGVSVATVKRLTASGQLPHVQVSSRRPRYAAADVARFIASKRSVTTADSAAPRCGGRE
jgi:excisionase family DNA binding protein